MHTDGSSFLDGIPEPGAASWRSICAGQDLDHARQAVGGLFVEHRLHSTRPGYLRPIDIRQNRLESVSLCYFDYGREVEIDPDVLSDFYLLLVPESGGAQVTSQGRSYLGPVGTAIMLPAEWEASMAWSDQTRKLVVQIDRRKLTSKLEAYLGQNLTRSPHFDLDAQDLSHGANPLRQTLDGLRMLASMPSGPGRELMCASLEEAFFGSLLHTLPSDMSSAIRDHALSTACPRAVRRAEEYVEAHLSEKIRIEDLARVSGTPARTLFEGFKRFRAMSPMQFLRFRRLHAARDALAESEPGAKVSDVAARFGFTHPGRFAAAYARQFGEAPSETLRRGKA